MRKKNKIDQSLTISITVILNILLPLPAQAESFENLLKSSLTPAEVEIYSTMGQEKA